MYLMMIAKILHQKIILDFTFDNTFVEVSEIICPHIVGTATSIKCAPLLNDMI